jgi:hypothetical protein
MLCHMQIVRTSGSAFIVAIALAAISVTTARAIQIDSQCVNMQDKVGCSCALQAGGKVYDTPDGRHHWVSPRKNDPSTQRCMQENR